MNLNPQRKTVIPDQEYEGQSLNQSSNWFCIHKNYRAPNKIQEMSGTHENLTQLIEQVNLDPIKVSMGICAKFCEVREKWRIPEESIKKIHEKRLQGIIKAKKIKRNWNKEDMILLLWVLENYCHLQKIQAIEEISAKHWQQISRCVPGTTGESCMFRILSLKKTKLSEKKWVQIEDKILKQLVKPKQKNNWRKIAENLYQFNTEANKIFRTSKQCKEHWNCYLNPQLRKGPWDLSEDIKLLQLVDKNRGVKSWAKLTECFYGRTQNALKNRYSLLLDTHFSEDISDQSEIGQVKYILKNLYQLKKKIKPKQQKNYAIEQQIYEDEQDEKNSNRIIGERVNQTKKEQVNIQAPKISLNENQNVTVLEQPNFVPIFYSPSSFYLYIGGKYM